MIEATCVDVNESGDIYALGKSEMFAFESGADEWYMVEDYWEQADFEIASILGMSFPVDQTGFFLGTTYNESQDSYKTDLFKTTSKGRQWNALNISFDKTGMDQWSYKDVFFADNSNGWIIGSTGSLDKEGFVLKTEDGGASWSTLLTEKAPSDIYFLEKSSGYLSYVSYPDILIDYTEDGGNTWYAYDTPFEDKDLGNPRRIFFIDKDHGWYANGEVVLRYALSGE